MFIGADLSLRIQGHQEKRENDWKKGRKEMEGRS